MTRSLWGIVVTALVVATAVPARADDAPPRIEHTAIAEARRGEPLEITAVITDPDGIFEPRVYFRPAGTTQYDSVALTGGPGLMTATLPAEITAADFEYFLEVYDGLGNGPTRSGNEHTPHRVAAVDRAPRVASLPPKVEGSATTPAAEPRLAPSVFETSLLADEKVESGVSGRFISGAVVLGLGAATAGAGAWFGLNARDLHAEAIGEPSAAVASAKLEDARSSALKANIGYAAGGALALTGLLLMIWPEPKEDPLHTVFLFGPSGAGVVGRF